MTETHTTALLVLDGPLGEGDVVHEWYADGVTPDSLLLGASMTKSVLAHLVGNAIASGELRLEDTVAQHVPELAGSGYAECTVEHVLTMTTGTAWVEDHRDPTARPRGCSRCFVGDGGSSRDLLAGDRADGPARHALGVQHRRLAGPRLGPRARHRHDVRRRADPAVGHARLRPRRRRGVDSRRRAAGRWRAGLLRGGLAAAGGAPAHRHGVRRPRARPRLGAALLHSPDPWMAPGRLPSSISTHVGFGYHWWPLDADGVRVTSDGSRGQFGYVDHDLRVAVLKTSLWPYDDFLVDRQQRDLSYLGLPLVAAAATTGP